MALEWIIEPVSDEVPCGPDLEQTGDPAFLAYYFSAEAGLPERYLLPRVFDPASVDIRGETAAITGLLKRSRDLRLLTLLARFEILAGRTKGFAEALEAIVALLEARPEAAHPALPKGSAQRRTALDNLSSTPWVVMPLQYLPLNGQTEVTLRRYQVANGQASPRDGEENLNPAQILDMLRSPGTRAKAASTQAELGRAAEALTRIAELCAANPVKPVTLDFSRPLGAIAEAQALIELADGSLTRWSAEKRKEAEPDAPEPVAEGAVVLTESPFRAPSVAQAGAAAEITSPAAVKVTLAAVERYLAQTEPSSATLLLVTQARLLVGKTLVEALETLLPGEAAKAVVDFGPTTGFALSMDKLKLLAAEARPAMGEESALSPPQPPLLRERADVAAQLRAVEAWYRKHEPASPIPLLLTRARTYLDKDFEAILSELLPAKAK